MRKKKILFVITKSNWGGAQKYVFDLANALKDTENVSVAYGGTGERNAPPGLLARKLTESGIHTIFIPSLERDVAWVREFPTITDLISLFREEQPDVVHLNSSKVGGLGTFAARVAGIPKIVFTLHGAPFAEKRPWYQRAVIALGTWATIVLSHRTIVITRKEFTLLSGWPLIGKKLSLIHNGFPAFPLMSREEARQKLALTPSDAWQLGTIAELHPSNNLSPAISAVAAYNHEHGKRIFFTIIGEGEEHGSLQALIEEKGAGKEIRLAGFQQNASSLLNAFDAFLFTPHKVGLPYVLLEAGSAGLPVIASGAGGIPDIINNGVTGILLPRSDAASIGHALEELFSNYSRDMGDKLREKVVSDFSLKRCTKETLSAYEN